LPKRRLAAGGGGCTRTKRSSSRSSWATSRCPARARSNARPLVERRRSPSRDPSSLEPGRHRPAATPSARSSRFGQRLSGHHLPGGQHPLPGRLDLIARRRPHPDERGAPDPRPGPQTPHGRARDFYHSPQHSDPEIQWALNTLCLTLEREGRWKERSLISAS